MSFLPSLFYLGLCFLAGTALIGRFLPAPAAWHRRFAPRKASARPNFLIVYGAASFCLGTLIVVWTTYFCAWAFRSSDKPMLYGNCLCFLLVGGALALKWKSQATSRKALLASFKKAAKQLSRLDAAFLASALALSAYLMFLSFGIDTQGFRLSSAIGGDMGFHVSMVRSFSQGANFPTQYAHFADGTVRYHFLYQFLVGNLEYLGMPLMWAMNLPSLLTFALLLALVRELGIWLTSSRAAGFLATLMLLFRSSPGAFFPLFPALGEPPSPHVWSLNVYINQRHLAFALCFLILILMSVLLRLPEKPKARRGSFWKIEEARESLFLGLVLGLLGFWNGSAVLSALAILGGLSLFLLAEGISFFPWVSRRLSSGWSRVSS